MPKRLWLEIQLLRRSRRDQKARTKWLAHTADPELARRVHEVDVANTKWIQSVVDQHGWPGRDLVGIPGSDAAWLLVQHADHDRAFQRQCLALLHEAVEAGQASPAHLAYLDDRLRVADGRPQVFGTQFQRVSGELVPYPIEDTVHVDERRRAIGLQPLDQYAAGMRQMHAPNEKPPPVQ
ncbi:MAG TPA: DUF6624 domain-containing protein [Candidatus Baltobacterales bacterium]|nr:DUF6624 domain-containing protein [Candidatus Baltobacterales bacterium]